MTTKIFLWQVESILLTSLSLKGIDLLIHSISASFNVFNKEMAAYLSVEVVIPDGVLLGEDLGAGIVEVPLGVTFNLHEHGGDEVGLQFQFIEGSLDGRTIDPCLHHLLHAREELV